MAELKNPIEPNTGKIRVKKLFRLTVAVILLGLAVSCGDKKAQSPMVVRVGNERLLLEDLQAMLPASYLPISRVQIEQFVQRWTENELIYQEAVRQKFDQQAQIQEQMARLRKEYIVASYLEHFVDRHVQVDEKEIQDYYAEKAAEFTREEDLYLFEFLVTESFRQANTLYQQINSGLEFAEAARENSLDVSKDNGGRVEWIALDRLSGILADRIAKLEIGRLSRPVKIEIGYALIRVLDKRKKGEPAKLEEVRDKLVWQLQVRKREQMYRKLISQLGENSDVESYFSVIQSAFADSAEQTME